MEMNFGIMPFSCCLQIKESIKAEQPCTVRILNYRLILHFLFLLPKLWSLFIYWIYWIKFFSTWTGRTKVHFGIFFTSHPFGMLLAR